MEFPIAFLLHTFLETLHFYHNLGGGGGGGGGGGSSSSSSNSSSQPPFEWCMFIYYFYERTVV